VITPDLKGLFAGAIEVVSESTASTAVPAGQHFRVHLARSLRALYCATAVVLDGQYLEEDPVEAIGLTRQGAHVLHAALEAVYARSSALAFIACLAIQADDSQSTVSEDVVDQQIRRLLEPRRKPIFPWYLGLTERRRKLARIELDAGGEIDVVLQQLLEIALIKIVDRRYRLSDHRLDIRFG
jgi:hypothetical protein